MGILKLFGKKTFARGVHPPESKELTADTPIRRLPFPDRLVVPLSQHLGTPAKPIVTVGQEVVRGEPIALAEGFMSVPIHAPATGVVTGIELMPTTRGPKAEAILIKVYAGDSQQVLYGGTREVENLSREEIIRAVQESGMVGLGGAGFPTHAKLSVPEGSTIDTLVVNGCECEPYLTTDHRVMLEYTDDLLAGIRIVMKAVGTKQAVIGVEDNKPDALAAIRARLAAGDPIRAEAVAAKYPQGSEKMLITALLGREVPSGGFPYQIGVVVQNVGTLAAVGRLLPLGEGLIERVVTITGPGVRKPGNYLIALGTPLRFVLEQVGFSGSEQQIILGGPMMGSTVASLDVPVTKAVSGILVLNPAALADEPVRSHPCIKCGHCIAACPMHLNPSQLGQLAAKRQYEAMAERFHLNDCIECGACAFVCPSRIPLVQYFRVAKAINREQAA